MRFERGVLQGRHESLQGRLLSSANFSEKLETRKVGSGRGYGEYGAIVPETEIESGGKEGQKNLYFLLHLAVEVLMYTFVIMTDITSLNLKPFQPK